ncbi:MAG: hypothetical protein KC486_26055 [Myxococcales bacterium]|nr:hypothetical protein [Myxococcales bacterium]
MVRATTAVLCALVTALACTPRPHDGAPGGPPATAASDPAGTDPSSPEAADDPGAKTTLPRADLILHLDVLSVDPPPRDPDAGPTCPGEPSLARSRCICEHACARRIDRERLAEHLLSRGFTAEEVQTWRDGASASLQLPYPGGGGLSIDYGRDGGVLRCRHVDSDAPEAALTSVCDELEAGASPREEAAP